MNKSRFFLGSYGVFLREIFRFSRAPLLFLLNPAINPILYLIVFGIVIGPSIHMTSQFPYISFLLSGMVITSIARIAFENTSFCLIIYKLNRELDEYRLAPLSPYQILLGLGMSSTLRALTVGAVTFSAGVLLSRFDTGMWSLPVHPFICLATLCFTAFTFSILGIWAGMAGKQMETVNNQLTLVLTPLIYLGGVFFPLSLYPPIIEKIAYFNPIFHFVNLVRTFFLGQALSPILPSIAYSALVFIVALVGATRALRKGINYHLVA